MLTPSLHRFLSYPGKREGQRKDEAIGDELNVTAEQSQCKVKVNSARLTRVIPITVMVSLYHT